MYPGCSPSVDNSHQAARLQPRGARRTRFFAHAPPFKHTRGNRLFLFGASLARHMPPLFPPPVPPKSARNVHTLLSRAHSSRTRLPLLSSVLYLLPRSREFESPRRPPTHCRCMHTHHLFPPTLFGATLTHSHQHALSADHGPSTSSSALQYVRLRCLAGTTAVGLNVRTGLKNQRFVCICVPAYSHVFSTQVNNNHQ